MKKGQVTILQVCGKTDVGRQRSSNEDSIAVFNKFEHPETGEAQLRGNLYIVADGMGGHRAGEVASSIAVEEIGRLYYGMDFSGVESTLIRAIKEANRRIYGRSQTVASTKGMGTTVAAAVIRGNELYTAHVGDSRVYLIRDGRIVFVTEDHSLVREQIRNEILTEEEAKRSPMRHIITRSLGSTLDVEVETHRLDLEEGDVVVLCSDGLWEPAGDEAIVVSSTRYIWDMPEVACEDLIETANQAGGPDNISVIVVGVKKIVPVGTSHPSAMQRAISQKQQILSGIPSIAIAVALALLLAWSITLYAIGRKSASRQIVTTDHPLSGGRIALATEQARKLASVTTRVVQLETRNAQMVSTMSSQKVIIATKEAALKASRTIPGSAIIPSKESPTVAEVKPSTPTPKPNLSPTAMPAPTHSPSPAPTTKTIPGKMITIETFTQLKQVRLPNIGGGTWLQVLRISPDGRTIAAIRLNGRLSDVYLWRYTSGRWKLIGHHRYPKAMSLAFSKDGKYMVIGASNGVYELKAPFDKWPEMPLVRNVGKVQCVDIYGANIAIGTDQRTIVRPMDSDAVKNVGTPMSCYSLQFSDDGKFLAIGGKGRVLLCKLSGNGKCSSLPVGSKTAEWWGTAFAGSRLILGADYGGVEIWDIQDADKSRLLNKLPTTSIYDVTVSKDGKLVIGATSDGLVGWKFDGKTLKEIDRLLKGKKVGSVDLSGDGMVLGVGYYDTREGASVILLRSK